MVKTSFDHARNMGFAYLAALFLVAIMGILLAATGVVWSTVQKRDKERDLLFVGHEFRNAIAAYYLRTPGTVKRYPNSFEDMLKDNRQLAIVRHLRRVYKDPITAQSNWGIVRAPDGGIMGIFSLSAEPTVKRNGFMQQDSGFENANNYQGWRFVFEPESLSKKNPGAK